MDANYQFISKYIIAEKHLTFWNMFYGLKLAVTLFVYICYMVMLILQILDIIGFIYQYFKLLRRLSPQEWIFKELQDIGNMEFRFAEKQHQEDYAVELAGIHINIYMYIIYMCRERERCCCFWMIVSTGECIASFRFLCNSQKVCFIYTYIL